MAALPLLGINFCIRQLFLCNKPPPKLVEWKEPSFSEFTSVCARLDSSGDPGHAGPVSAGPAPVFLVSCWHSWSWQVKVGLVERLICTPCARTLQTGPNLLTWQLVRAVWEPAEVHDAFRELTWNWHMSSAAFLLVRARDNSSPESRGAEISSSRCRERNNYSHCNGRGGGKLFPNFADT